MKLDRSYSGIQVEILDDFSALLDYVWKSPRFVQYEADLEEKKLEAYFPKAEADANPRVDFLRRARKHFEDDKLHRHFPRYIATSNLFLATSLFEHYLLSICRKAEKSCEQKIADQRGNGCERFFRFLKEIGFETYDAYLYNQVDAALTIRNAMLHANGDLRLSRERRKVENICNKELFIEPSRRKIGNGMADEWGKEEISISSDLNYVNINNFYSYRATAYYRDYLLDVSKPLYPEHEAGFNS